MRAVLFVTMAAALGAQVRVPPPSAVPAKQGSLRCEVTTIRPSLNYALRLQTGFDLGVPLSQYQGPNHRWSVTVKVTPQDGSRPPVYLGSRFHLPPVPADTKTYGHVGGGFLVGEGQYNASMFVRDDQGRTCSHEWQIEARVDRAARNLPPAMEPGKVAALTEPFQLSVREPVFDRLTVLLHAAPVRSRASKLQPNDVWMWMGELAGLMQQAPARSVRLAVFNLAQQKELYRQEDFHLSELNRISESIYNLQLQTVDYRILQNRTGDADLLANLVKQEITSSRPSDTVIFLGPRYWSPNKVPAVVTPPEGGPRFFYLDYRRLPNVQLAQLSMLAPTPAPPRGPVDFDIIAGLISRLKGKTIDVTSPSDFAKAIRRIK